MSDNREDNEIKMMIKKGGNVIDSNAVALAVQRGVADWFKNNNKKLWDLPGSANQTDSPIHYIFKKTGGAISEYYGVEVRPSIVKFSNSISSVTAVDEDKKHIQPVVAALLAGCVPYRYKNSEEFIKSTSELYVNGTIGVDDMRAIILNLLTDKYSDWILCRSFVSSYSSLSGDDVQRYQFSNKCILEITEHAKFDLINKKIFYNDEHKGKINNYPSTNIFINKLKSNNEESESIVYGLGHLADEIASIMDETFSVANDLKTKQLAELADVALSIVKGLDSNFLNLRSDPELTLKIIEAQNEFSRLDVSYSNTEYASIIARGKIIEAQKDFTENNKPETKFFWSANKFKVYNKHDEIAEASQFYKKQNDYDKLIARATSLRELIETSYNNNEKSNVIGSRIGKNDDHLKEDHEESEDDYNDVFSNEFGGSSKSNKFFIDDDADSFNELMIEKILVNAAKEIGGVIDDKKIFKDIIGRNLTDAELQALKNGKLKISSKPKKHKGPFL